MTFATYSSAKQVGDKTWQAKTPDNLLLDYKLYDAFESSLSAVPDKGWQANHIAEREMLLPCYIKQHSWGEYIFDQSWADAYHRYGYPYYPKLVSCIPFTPITGEKAKNDNYLKGFELLTEVAQQQSVSGWHWLFIPKQQRLLENVVQRTSVQFHWLNKGYTDFEEFVSDFSSRKRKNTKKERLSIQQQDIEIVRLTGREISQQQLDYFYLCYQMTYLKRGHSPHLSLAFFQNIVSTLGDNILLVMAYRHQQPIACAWFFFDEQNCYGRYWGSTEQIQNLHFELCYYQGIEFCIQRGIGSFNPGTQGEHKIQRGFKPTLQYSYHWLANPEFQQPIANFSRQEHLYQLEYAQHCTKSLPFKAKIEE